MDFLRRFTTHHVSLVCALFLTLSVLILACEPQSRVSAARAKEHTAALVKTATEDVREVRDGLPQGASHLESLFTTGKPAVDDASAAREALERARNKVQDLRTSKGTFFAVVDGSGAVIRNDREQDLMAGKNLFAAYPELKAALSGKYVETQGVMPEAAGVKGRDDAQWVAAAPVKVEGQPKGLYATGWSWSSYAFRLENSLRTELRGKLGEHDKMPLVYVFIAVGDKVYGAPQSPDVNIETIAKLKVLEKAKGAEPFSTELEITGRGFGLAAQRVPALGENVAVVVLRSET